jgi:hypothetical protein
MKMMATRADGTRVEVDVTLDRTTYSNEEQEQARKAKARARARARAEAYRSAGMVRTKYGWE